MEKEEQAAIALSLIKGIGVQMIRALYEHFGSFYAVFKLTDMDLQEIPRLRKSVLNRANFQRALDKAAIILGDNKRNGIRTILWNSKEYPARLKHCVDAPTHLFCSGNGNLEGIKVLSIVGTRKPSPYGKRLMEKISNGLSESGIQIVSGLAYGIDTMAHNLALENSLSTIAVLGTPLSNIYPGENRKLAMEIKKNGCLVSEYYWGQDSVPSNFAMRNRIIAGMSDGVIIVETATKGGAMITARLGNSYNRDVFAFPGRVGDLYSSGCNSLIRNNEAHLVESISDVKRLLGWEANPKRKNPQASLALDLSDEEQQIFDLIRQLGEPSIDDIAIHLSWEVSKTSVVLLGMEMKSYVQEIPGKRYLLNV